MTLKRANNISFYRKTQLCTLVFFCEFCLSLFALDALKIMSQELLFLIYLMQAILMHPKMKHL